MRKSSQVITNKCIEKYSPQPFAPSVLRSLGEVERIEGLKYLLCLLLFCFSLNAKKFTIMLSPEGDSTNPGRSLQDGFECGFTRQYAELLKETLEQDSTIRVIMSHESGEQVSQYEKASFANRLDVDLYISINFYASEKPNISVYYYKSTCFDPPTDATRLELYPTTKAYLFNNEKTKKKFIHLIMLFF